MEQVLTWILPVFIIFTMLAAFAEYAIGQRSIVESQYAVASFWGAVDRLDVRDVLRLVVKVMDGTLSLWFGPKLVSVNTLIRWTIFSVVASMIVSTSFLLTYEGGLLEPLTQEHHLKVALSTLLAIVTVDFGCLVLHRWMLRNTRTVLRFFVFVMGGVATTYIAVSCCNIIFYFEWMAMSSDTFRDYFLWPATMWEKASQIVLFMPAFLVMLLFITCLVIVVLLGLTRFISKPLTAKIVRAMSAGPKGILTIGAFTITILAALIATVHASFITN